MMSPQTFAGKQVETVHGYPMSHSPQPLQSPTADAAAAGPREGGVSAELWLAGTVLLAALAVFSLGALSWMV
jgi:hypothetical protein